MLRVCARQSLQKSLAGHWEPGN